MAEGMTSYIVCKVDAHMLMGSFIRQHQATTVVRADHATLARAYELWREAREASWSIRGFTFSMAFQPITLNMIRHGDANVLGLNSRSEPLVNILLTNQWHYAKVSSRLRAC